MSRDTSSNQPVHVRFRLHETCFEAVAAHDAMGGLESVLFRLFRKFSTAPTRVGRAATLSLLQFERVVQALDMLNTDTCTRGDAILSFMREARGSHRHIDFRSFVRVLLHLTWNKMNRKLGDDERIEGT
jgi:hypothetical protein